MSQKAHSASSSSSEFESMHEASSRSVQPPDGCDSAPIAPEYIAATPFRRTVALELLQWLLVLVTGGIYGLVMLWHVPARFWLRRRCEPSQATSFLVCDSQNLYESAVVHEREGVRFFEHQCLRYVLTSSGVQPPLRHASAWTHSSLLAARKKKSQTSAGISTQRRVQHGPNSLVVPLPLLWWDLLCELLGPVYVYQYACCILWVLHDYLVFAIAMLLLIWASGIYDVIMRRRQRRRLAVLAALAAILPTRRGGVGTWTPTPASALCPGDVVKLSEGHCVCDLALVQGSAVVDEAALTGESLPVTKTPPALADARKLYEPEKDRRVTLYCGTRVLQAEEAIAVVVRTGWQTSKGALLRSILHTPAVTYQYEAEARIFLGILAGVGVLFFSLSLWLWGAYEKDAFEPGMLLYAFETIAILVPPMLPLVFHVGLLLAARRLVSDARVFTTAPSRIPGAGTVRTMCFDKTGTLTRTALDVLGALPLSGGSLANLSPLPALSSASPALEQAIATCHQLSVVPGDTQSYSGPTIDVQMFNALGSWTYEDATFNKPAMAKSKNGRHELEVLRRFEFEHSLQRMSAVVRNGKKMRIVCKGSVEAMAAVCVPSSLPPDLTRTAQDCSRNGCYVIALAQKKLPLAAGYSGTERPPPSILAALDRKDVEKDLHFLGLLLLRNELKDDTVQAILALQAARVRPVMVTGDNVYTAIYIARACSLISRSSPCWVGDVSGLDVVYKHARDESRTLTHGTRPWIDEIRSGSEWALTAAAFDHLLTLSDPFTRRFLTEKVLIFARMKPLQKAAFVQALKEADHVTGMVGDGANDCAALSVAHVGVALSEAEASLVAAFTARTRSCVAAAALVREGRATLANAFAAFKYTIIYGLVQVTQAMLAYAYGSDLAQAQYVIIDFGLFVPLMFFLVKSRAVPSLRGNPPTANVFGPTTLSSLLGMLTLFVIFFAALIKALEAQTHWYKPHRRAPGATKPVFDIAETTTLFLAGNFLYIGAGLALGWGGRWRRYVWRNLGLMITLALCIAAAVAMLMLSPEWDLLNLGGLLQMLRLDLRFRLFILAAGLIAMVDLVLLETLIIAGPVAAYLRYVTGTGRIPLLVDENVHVVEEDALIMKDYEESESDDDGEVALSV